ncbi:MAG: alpha/beta hydrolase [Patescibacteria group bacterium]
MFKRSKLPYNQTFLFHGHKINYQIYGKGKPVIFVHGAFTNSDPYKESLELLGKKFEVNVIDLPGFGGSDVIKGKIHNTELFSDTLGAFIKDKHLEKAPIIALSLGVIVTLKAVLKYNIGADLVFVAAPGKTSNRLKTKFFANLPIQIKRFLVSTNWGRRKILLPVASANTGTSPHTSDMRLKVMSNTSNEAMVDSNYLKDIEIYEGYLSEVKNKMVFIYGEHDRMKHNRIGSIKEFIEIPGSGHNVFVESPDDIVKVLSQLL